MDQLLTGLDVPYSTTGSQVRVSYCITDTVEPCYYVDAGEKSDWDTFKFKNFFCVYTYSTYCLHRDLNSFT
jgi:hypothetical protein